MLGDLLGQIKDRVRRDLEAQTNSKDERAHRAPARHRTLTSPPSHTHTRILPLPLRRPAAVSALVLEGVFASAEERGVPLAIEMARTEDEGALARIRDLNTALIADADLKKRGPTGGKLESIRDEHARLIADNTRMADEARALRERYSAMEAQASAASRQSAELSGRVASLTAELGGLRSGLSAADSTKAAHEAEVAKLRGAVADISAQLERTKVRVRACVRAPEMLN